MIEGKKLFFIRLAVESMGSPFYPRMVHSYISESGNNTISYDDVGKGLQELERQSVLRKLTPEEKLGHLGVGNYYTPVEVDTP